MRPALCEDALRLGRILAELAPRRARGARARRADGAAGVAARARGAARDGEPILLLDQDRARWDRLLIGRGLRGARARARRSAARSGPYALQAAIAACHARARTPEDTDWARIAALYDALASSRPRRWSSSTARSRSRWRSGRRPGSSSSTRSRRPALADYHLLPSVRGDLLERLGRRDEARAEFGGPRR